MVLCSHCSLSLTLEDLQIIYLIFFVSVQNEEKVGERERKKKYRAYFAEKRS